jgi:hypothetical protein
LAIAPFDDACRAPAPDDVRREADVVLRRDREDAELPLFERVRPELDRAFLDDRALLDEPEEPFLFVDLFVLELPLDELLLEDRVVCAICYRLSWLPCQLLFSRRRSIGTTRWGEI